jgi:hypothetical protein
MSRCWSGIVVRKGIVFGNVSPRLRDKEKLIYVGGISELLGAVVGVGSQRCECPEWARF